MTEDMLAVPASLAESVASISRWRNTPGVETIVRLPETSSSIVIHRDAHGTAMLSAVGPRQRAYYKPSPALAGHCRITFRAGHARSALGVSPSELGGAVELRALWGRSLERIVDAISAASDATSNEAIAHLLAMLELRPSHRSIASVIAARAARAIANDVEATSVRAIAARVGVSERFLRNAFRDEIGVSPKRYARIERIRRAAAAMNGQISLADMAARHGFFDQAHLNAEFRALLGTTPTAFRARQFPTGSDCGAAIDVTGT